MQQLSVVDTSEIQRLIFSIEKLLNAHTAAPTVTDELSDLVTHVKAAEILGISAWTLYQLSAGGKIPYFKKGKRNYYSRAAIASYIRSSVHPEKKEYSANQLPG